MPEKKPLAASEIIAFVPIVDVVQAKHFYGEILGLQFLNEELPFALVFDANGIMLRLIIAKELPPRFGTALGWRVADAAATVNKLTAAGIVFEQYEGMKQDSLAIWTAPTGAKVAWFKDPDGNILSISEHPELDQ